MPATKVRCTSSAKPSRFLRVIGEPVAGRLMVEVEDRRPTTSKYTHYFVSELTADYGRAFAFEKFGTEGGERYALNLGDGETPASCECLGHLRWNHRTECRHIACARKLIDLGKV